MQHRRRLLWIASASLGLCSFLSPGTTLADGCYIAERAIKKMPAIPAQRAILVYKDQTERLIIESTLSAEGQRFGWIVPVPAKPVKMEAISPGLFKTLFVQTRPEATHEPFSPIKIWLFALGASLAAVWALVVVVLNPSSGENVLKMCLALLMALPLSMCLWFAGCGTLASEGSIGRQIPGIQVDSVSTIGSYEITLLQAESPDSLNRWLDEGGFASLPPGGDRLVADYIHSGWHFVAARLQRDGQGVARPHPLALEFPSDRAVYPMRLTALANCPVALELLIVSKERALADGLTAELAAAFSRTDYQNGRVHYRPTERVIRAAVSHPDVDTLLWHGCWLTRLAGTLQPKDMLSDIWVKWEAGTPYQCDLYSYSGARTIAGAWAVSLWFVGLPIAFFCVHACCAIEGRRRKYLLRGLLPVLAACGLLFLAVYLSLDKVEVDQRRGQHTRYSLWERTGSLLLATREGQDLRSLEEFRKAGAKRLADADLRNYFTSEPMLEEDSPGNYALREDKKNGGYVMVWFDMYMVERSLSIP